MQQQLIKSRQTPKVAGKTTSPLCVMAVNVGSSSIRFALYEVGLPLKLKLNGKLERIGLHGTSLTFKNADKKTQEKQKPSALDRKYAIHFLLSKLEAFPTFSSVKSVGHRIVHGMQHSAPEPVTPKLLSD